MGCQSVCIELIERKLCARPPAERLQSQKTGERMVVKAVSRRRRWRAAPALSPADHRSTSKTQLLPGDRACLPPSPADRSCLSPVGPTRLRKLDASVGRQDHTTSPYAATSFVSSPFDRSRAFRQPALPPRCAPNAAASTASHPASLTIRIRPSVGRDARVLDLIWVRWQEIFFGKSEKRLDSPVKKPPDGQIT